MISCREIAPGCQRERLRAFAAFASTLLRSPARTRRSRAWDLTVRSGRMTLSLALMFQALADMLLSMGNFAGRPLCRCCVSEAKWPLRPARHVKTVKVLRGKAVCGRILGAYSKLDQASAGTSCPEKSSGWRCPSSMA